MKRMLLLFLFYCMWLSQGYAQIQIEGSVFSAEDQEPVIGASIRLKGTSTGTITDMDGMFSITVQSVNDVLEVSYVGMEPQQVVASRAKKIILQSATQDIDEVIVVAYGTARKSSFTGSAGNLGKEKLGKLQVSEISKALEGSIAGVQISSSSGQPGASASIRIRGIGSINASSSPLIVLDGVPYEGELNTINPQDIESMNVLKDAAANSLYGARGANGVLMITTKKGSAGKTRVTFDNRTGINYKGLSTQNILTSPGEYYELFWEALRNQQFYSVNNSAAASAQYASDNLVTVLGGYNSFSVPNGELIDPVTGRLNPQARLLYHEDWLDEAFSTGFRQENNLSISGQNNKTSYYLSLGYLYDDSYTAKSDYSRYSVRLKLDQELTDFLSIGVNIGAMKTDSKIPSTVSTGLSNIFYTGQTIAPIYPVYRMDNNGNRILDNNGNPLYDYGITEGRTRPIASNSNAIAQQAGNIREGNNNVTTAKMYARVKFLKDFLFTANLSADNFDYNSTDFQTPTGGDALSVNGRGTRSSSHDFSINTNQLLNWNRDFEDHNFEALLGHEYKKDQNSYLSASKTNFFLPTNPELSNGVDITDATSGKNSYSLEGYFFQLKYNYLNKYYLSGSFRRDASSRFHPDSRWGSFWSVGGAWRVNSESFMQPYTFINDLKLKASFGTQGNDNIGSYLPYLDQYNVVPQNGQPGIIYTFRGNRNITWEKSNNFNAGIEYRLWNRINGSIEYFYKQTWDLLYAKPLAPSQGSPTAIYENTMRMVNNGVEAEINADLINRDRLIWNLSLNLTHYRNKLTELPPDKNQNGWANGNKFLRKGASIYNWYGYEYAGVNENNGAPLYYADLLDEQGNVIGRKKVEDTTEATKYEYGKSSVPDLYGGFSSSVTYKAFDLSVSFAYQLGGWAFDTQYQNFMHGGTAGLNWHKDVYKRWTPENTQTDVPRLQTGFQDLNASTDRFLTKASYLSLRNVTFGYSLPSSLLQKIGATNIRVYAVADNLFLISARKGFDPRQSFSGNTGFSYSPMSTCSIGFNITY